VARDVIMDAFWPDASTESARNSLNVAIYSLRQALKPVIDIPVVLFQENTYLLNPRIVTWLDLAAFEQSVQSGREYEAKGRLAEATRSYEHALSLYQGDLLSEFPYEDWVAIERERLRVLYLETLDRLSMIYFSQGQYAACVALCQRMLTRDASREDAHCRLMRCYVRLGQSHMAIRQYQVCVDSLRSELDVLPSPVTVQLFEQIRRREQV
jgi:DNA-binding SARP family transcriptional activator